MSFTAPSFRPVDMTAPDRDQEFRFPGARRLTLQISNQAVYLTFGRDMGAAVLYGDPEPYLPVVGQVVRDFDAVKIRAYTPAAQLPAGATQANIKATAIK